MPQPAVFLDRDGVLIEDVHLLTRPDQIVVFSYVPAALRRLKQAGWVLVVVSNQAVVARGLVTEAEVVALHLHLQGLLDNCIDHFYFCPHHPNATLPTYRQDCACRKPRPGMLFQSAHDLDLDLKASYMIGDRPSDIEAGYQAGCATILVSTGMEAQPLIESTMPIKATPDYTCNNLEAAVRIILEKQ